MRQEREAALRERDRALKRANASRANYRAMLRERNEAVDVLKALTSDDAAEAATHALIPALVDVFGCDEATAWNTLYGPAGMSAALAAAVNTSGGGIASGSGSAVEAPKSRDSLADAPPPEESDRYDLVGEGPTYEAIRAEARKLVPLFQPPGPSFGRGRWGAGLADVEPVDGGHRVSIVYPVCSRFEKDRNSIMAIEDLFFLRATGIALLAYCEAHEMTIDASSREPRS
jgi:hypothetical protein